MKPRDATDDLETLSALFDGELREDTRQFAMRRLSHDADWQAASGRWQLIGDAMRRQSSLAAPAGFADRVRDAIAAESPTAPVAVPVRRRPRLMPWIGGALAASVALVAVFVALPSRDVAPTQASPSVAVQPAPVQSSPIAVPAAAAPAVAEVAHKAEPVAEAPRSAMATRIAQSRAAAPTRPARRSPGATAPDEPATALVATTVPTDPANPFRLPSSGTLQSRPWPHASLTGSAASSLTTGFEAAGQDGGTPSFYPFEPRPRPAAQGEAP